MLRCSSCRLTRHSADSDGSKVGHSLSFAVVEVKATAVERSCCLSVVEPGAVATITVVTATGAVTD